MTGDLRDLSLEELWRLFPVELKEYSSDYPRWFEAQKSELEKILHPSAIFRLSHIGSTAVPGLFAKPVVDILLEMNPGANLQEFSATLEDHDWIEMHRQTSPHPWFVLNKGYTAQGYASRVFHLHLRYTGDWDELYFRDYLRSNPAVCEEYAMLKKDLQVRFTHNRDAYTAAKTDFIKSCTRYAREQFPGRFAPQ